MKVNPDSPVVNKDSYLYKWDTCARRYFNHFEIHKNAAKHNLQSLFHNIFTMWRDPLHFEWRFRYIDILHHKQQLGDISSAEVAELNSVQGLQNGYYFTKGRKEPAHIFAWRWFPMLALWGFGGGLAVYAKFVKKYNILWFVAPFVPLWVYIVYNAVRQPYV